MLRHRWYFALINCVGCVLVTVNAWSVNAADDVIEYNRDIRPILAEKCFACHGPDSASRKADLRLDGRDMAIEMGALVPGEPDESEMIVRIVTDDADLLMPPPETKKTLTDEEKGLLRQWVIQGGQYQRHWSLIPPVVAETPALENEGWAKNDIDRFVLARLEAEGLTPAPEADPRTLFRRLHLDITGLPPKSTEVDSFEGDYRRDADATMSKWIDRLMQRPAWGEHRARYWLDAARYADTHGLHFDNYREMWPYRDWVIRAFNANQPYDEFALEQIAGDLLDDPSDDQLIATGFQRCNITTNEGGTIDEENLANYAADRVQTFGWVFLATTTNCAQCHDHKFDEFTMRDYYSLAAFFRNTTQPAKDRNSKDGGGPVIPVPTMVDQPRWKALPSEIAVAEQNRDTRRADAKQPFRQWIDSVDRAEIHRQIPVESLLLHLRLNEGEGNQVANDVGEKTEFASVGDLEWRDGGKFGRSAMIAKNRTISLEGIGDFEIDQPFTLTAWIRAGRGNVNGAIVARMDQDADFRGWDLYQSNRKLAVHLVDRWPDNALKVSTEADVLKPGQWQHVVMTYDGSGKPEGITFYVDGIAATNKVDTQSLASDATIRTSTPTRIGQRSKNQYFEAGSLQDLRLYSRALNDAEAQALHEAGTLHLLLSLAAESNTSDALFEHYLFNVDPEFARLEEGVSELKAEQRAIRGRSPITHIQRERMDQDPTAAILLRGQYDTPGAEVVASTPESLHPFPKDAPADRLGLAQWTVDPANPLTARVTVNRFWQEIFGRGLVPTPEDFGVMGAPPSHPALLDWLAIEFQSSGWDVKELFKLMLMSATYRQSAVLTDEKIEKDRDNALLSRGPRFRMDAEMIRDYALAASGLLSDRMFGPGTRPYQPTNIWDVVGLPGGNTRNYEQDKGENLYRRSIYNFWKRMAPPPNLEALNAPSREVCAVRRERTNTPLQALVTLNDPQFVEAARAMAEHAMKEAAAAEKAHSGQQSIPLDARIVEFIARNVLSRSFTPFEERIVLQNKRELAEHYEAHKEDAKKLIGVGDSEPSDEVSPIELAAWTLVCNQVLNLDEVLNK